ncbi:hypothetical protein [Bradyrhizobium lupini]
MASAWIANSGSQKRRGIHTKLRQVGRNKEYVFQQQAERKTKSSRRRAEQQKQHRAGDETHLGDPNRKVRQTLEEHEH